MNFLEISTRINLQHKIPENILKDAFNIRDCLINITSFSSNILALYAIEKIKIVERLNADGKGIERVISARVTFEGRELHHDAGSQADDEKHITWIYYHRFSTKARRFPANMHSYITGLQRDLFMEIFVYLHFEKMVTRGNFLQFLQEDGNYKRKGIKAAKYNLLVRIREKKNTAGSDSQILRISVETEG